MNYRSLAIPIWKVRHLFDLINDCAKMWVKHPRDGSIDEGMVKYFGPHNSIH